ncbi:hypothetical protein A3N42_23540 [Klebsiella aerogenes]|nr:hypothetical protein A3N42_23540 [Klebsiella aerogenes]
MQHSIANTRITFFWIQVTSISPACMPTAQYFVRLLYSVQRFPCHKSLFIELQEYPFTMDLISRYPIRFAP